jgi:hypothetical protein
MLENIEDNTLRLIDPHQNYLSGNGFHPEAGLVAY